MTVINARVIFTDPNKGWQLGIKTDDMMVFRTDENARWSEITDVTISNGYKGATITLVEWDKHRVFSP